MSVHHVLTVAVSLFSLAHGYHTGAPEFTCQTMMPQHNKTPNADAAPYQVDVSRTTYTSGQTVNVTLVCNSTEWPMEGFLLIARRVSNNDSVGTFTSFPSSAQLRCSGSGVTHVNNTQLNSTSFVWTPAAGAGDVYFIATVVRGLSRGFWTNLRSASVVSASMVAPELTTAVAASALQTAATTLLVAALSLASTTFFFVARRHVV